jgi:hypothetical protein
VHAVAEIQDTPERVLLAVDGLGLGTTDHVVPFHDSIRVLLGPLTVRLWLPTAVHAVAETHDTLERKLRVALGLGLGTTDHAVPFHDSPEG